jgi:hypothetical protein
MEILAQQAAAGPDAKPLFMYLAYTDVRACPAVVLHIYYLHSTAVLQPHAGGWQGTEESGQPVPSDGDYASKDWPNVEKDHASVITNYQACSTCHIAAETFASFVCRIGMSDASCSI